MSPDAADFDALVGAITNVHQQLQRHAARTVNSALTMRNWLIGCYVHEYELGGRDRAEYYGELLLERLASRLKAQDIPRTDVRELRRYRLSFLTYPQIREALPDEFTRVLIPARIDSKIRDSMSPESLPSGDDLLRHLSFTHIRELLTIDDPAKRAFTEYAA